MSFADTNFSFNGILLSADNREWINRLTSIFGYRHRNENATFVVSLTCTFCNSIEQNKCSSIAIIFYDVSYNVLLPEGT